MNRLFILMAAVFLMTLTAEAQRKYDYSNISSGGVELYYQRFDAEEVVPGPSGTNRVWDFTELKPLDQPRKRRIVRPDSLAKAEFPEANYIEMYSDSTFSALKEEYGRTYRIGYYDGPQEIKITYHLPMLIQRFPMSYKDVVSKSYTSFFEMKDHRFSSEGKVKIEADGFGKLRLPDTVYQSVMRLRLNREQTDFIEKYDTVQKSTVTTYMWFDENNKYPILILQKDKSGDQVKKEAHYLKSSDYKGHKHRNYRYKEY